MFTKRSMVCEISFEHIIAYRIIGEAMRKAFQLGSLDIVSLVTQGLNGRTGSTMLNIAQEFLGFFVNNTLSDGPLLLTKI